MKARFLIPLLAAGSFLGGIAGSALFGVNYSWAQDPKSRRFLDARTIVTDRLRLMDANGNLRAVLSTKSDGRPFLALYSRAGQLRAELAVRDGDYGELWLLDRKKNQLLLAPASTRTAAAEEARLIERAKIRHERLTALMADVARGVPGAEAKLVEHYAGQGPRGFRRATELLADILKRRHDKEKAEIERKLRLKIAVPETEGKKP